MEIMDVVAAIHQRQGYCVYASKVEKNVDDIITRNLSTSAYIPLRIIGSATQEEAVSQFKLARELAPEIVTTEQMDPAFKFFYRVEAVD